jgi:hypothetical protein
MKEFQFYIILVGLMFIGFNVGFIIFDYQHLINQSVQFGKGTISIFGIIGIFVHSCAILGTLVFGYFRVKEANELDEDK